MLIIAINKHNKYNKLNKKKEQRLMGFLNIKGKMLTYEQYKDLIQKYKDRGILEFIELYNAHKDKKKERRDLHWGEELEYMLFHLNEDRSEAKLTN